jgi:hypothetical protein
LLIESIYLRIHLPSSIPSCALVPLHQYTTVIVHCHFLDESGMLEYTTGSSAGVALVVDVLIGVTAAVTAIYFRQHTASPRKGLWTHDNNGCVSCAA